MNNNIITNVGSLSMLGNSIYTTNLRLYESGSIWKFRNSGDTADSSINVLDVTATRNAVITNNISSQQNISGKWFIATSTVQAYDMLLTSAPVALFNYYLNASSLTIVRVANAYEVLCGTGTLDPVSAHFIGKPDVNGNNNRITCRYAKSVHKYLVTVNGCMQTNSSNPTTPSIQLRKNGVLASLAENSPYLSIQNKDTAFGLNTVIQLANNDYLEIYVTTDDGDDLLADHINISITTAD